VHEGWSVVRGGVLWEGYEGDRSAGSFGGGGTGLPGGTYSSVSPEGRLVFVRCVWSRGGIKLIRAVYGTPGR